MEEQDAHFERDMLNEISSDHGSHSVLPCKSDDNNMNTVTTLKWDFC